jgi:hypothetical protein
MEQTRATDIILTTGSCGAAPLMVPITGPGFRFRNYPF